MTKYGGQRLATADGAMLADPASLGNLAGAALEAAFEPGFWAARGELIEATGGRGSAWFVSGSGRWVLRHYRRGGWIARLSRDRYLWAGEARVRAFAEYYLLAELVRSGLPVPQPVAARYQRTGPFYRCDLIMQRIAGARPLSSVLSFGDVNEGTWREIGAAVARLHAAGADHADLNAHNILVDDDGAVSVIDFDRGTLRTPAEKSGAWAAKNLSRLHRSLVKVSRDLPPGRFSRAAWDRLLAGYQEPISPPTRLT
jgi:3-deoxy-D-manno-octulosonic acid kinase